MRVLCFGSLNYDDTYEVDHFPVPKETLAAGSYRRNFGGKGLNQSLAMARAGLNVWHAGRVGPDGGPLRDFLKSGGVHADLIRTDDRLPTGHAIIEVCRAQNRILLYGGANRAVDEAQVRETVAAFGRGDLLVLQNEIFGIPCIMKAARERGMTVFFNAAPMGEEVFSYPLDLVDILCVNEVEGAALLARDCPGATEPRRVAELLHEKYPHVLLLLTAGEDGSYGCRGEEFFHVPAQQVRAVDTTAAGDTWSGHFLAGLCGGKSLRESMKLATMAAALAVQAPGAAPSIPSLSRVKNALAGQMEEA